MSENYNPTKEGDAIKQNDARQTTLQTSSPNTSASSSDSSSPSPSLSSTPKKPKSFEFNGQLYRTYQEMVDAKRERIRVKLEQTVSEVASVIGKVKSSDSVSAATSTNNHGVIQKRKGASSKSVNDDASTTTSLRRSLRHTSGPRSYKESENSDSDDRGTTKKSRRKMAKKGPSSAGSVSSLSTHQSALRKKRGHPRLDVQRNRKNEGSCENQRRNKDKDKSMNCLKDNQDDWASSDSGTSISPQPARKRHRAQLHKPPPRSATMKKELQPKSSPIILSKQGNQLSATPKSSKPLLRGRNRENVSILPNSTVNDMSMILDHVVMNGYRVRTREGVWNDFYKEDVNNAEEIGIGKLGDKRGVKCNTRQGDNHLKMVSSRGNDYADDVNFHQSQIDQQQDQQQTQNESTTTANIPKIIHIGDWKLYQPVMDNLNHSTEDHQCHNKMSHDDDIKKKFESELFHSNDSFDDDIMIPEEFLVGPNSCNNRHESKYNRQGAINQMQQSQRQPQQQPLPFDDPVHCNNIIRKQNAYYVTEGVDCQWDKEFGDGFDPSMFVQERCITAGDCGNANGSQKENEDESGVSSSAARNYTSTLLQRCWDRAVHAVSSTITSAPMGDNGNENESGSEVMAAMPPNNVHDKEEDDDSSIHQRQVLVDSVLHREAMNIVDSLLDVLLSDGSSARALLDANESDTNPCFNWQNVLKCFQEVVDIKTGMDPDTKCSVPTVQVNTNRCPIPLNHSSLKVLSMRLLERYGAEARKMPA